MKKVFLALFVILFVFACSNDLAKKESPAYRPVTAQWVASVDTTGKANGVYTISGFAFVEDGPAGLQLVNNRELRSLRIVVSYNTLGETRNVYGLASTVYVAGSGFGLGVFDVINRSSLNTNGHFLVHPYR